MTIEEGKARVPRCVCTLHNDPGQRKEWYRYVGKDTNTKESKAEGDLGERPGQAQTSNHQQPGSDQRNDDKPQKTRMVGRRIMDEGARNTTGKWALGRQSLNSVSQSELVARGTGVD